MIRQESQQRVAKRIRKVLEIAMDSGLLIVSAMSRSDTLELTKKEEIKVACHKENAKKCSARLMKHQQ